MKSISDKQAFTSIEFFLSVISLFLLFIIAQAIFKELIERTQISLIKENLNQISDYAQQHFEEHATNSVSLYEFVGPRKVISELEIIADEEYPEKIFWNKEISAYSKKYGKISVQKGRP